MDDELHSNVFTKLATGIDCRRLHITPKFKEGIWDHLRWNQVQCQFSLESELFETSYKTSLN